jgi:hypothetical protein
MRRRPARGGLELATLVARSVERIRDQRNRLCVRHSAKPALERADRFGANASAGCQRFLR